MLKKMEDILAQCIEDVKAGRCSIEDCLAKYPSVRKELEPLLRIALNIQELPDVKPSADFKVRARVQLMEQIHAKQAVTKWPWFRYTYQLQPILYKRRFNMVAIIIAIVLAVSAAGGGTAYASQGSLPGDFLYPVKLGTEQARLVVATNDTAKAELYLNFAESRVGEMAALAERGRPENVDIAVSGYDNAVAMAIEKIEAASGKGLATANISEVVALAISIHLTVLDEVYGKVADEAKDAILGARAVSMTGMGNALADLATVNPARAMEINLAAIEGRLNRANDEADENNIEGVEIAVHEFVQLSGFSDNISDIARGLSDNISDIARGLSDNRTVDELRALATSHHLKVLALVYGKVPGQAKGAIESAMAVVEGYEEEEFKALWEEFRPEWYGQLPPGSEEWQQAWEEFKLRWEEFRPEWYGQLPPGSEEWKAKWEEFKALWEEFRPEWYGQLPSGSEEWQQAWEEFKLRWEEFRPEWYGQLPPGSEEWIEEILEDLEDKVPVWGQP